MKPDSLAQQAWDSQRTTPLEEVLRADEKTRATAKRHGWFGELIERIETEPPEGRLT